MKSFGRFLVIRFDGAHETLLLLHVFHPDIDVNLGISTEERHIVGLVRLFDGGSLAQLALTWCMLQSRSLDLPSQIKGSSHSTLFVVTNFCTFLSDDRLNYILETCAEAGVFLFAAGLLGGED